MATQITNFRALKPAQPVCTVAICPEYPEFLVVGTYKLLEKDEPREYPAQVRTGSLEVMPISVFSPTYPGQKPPKLDKKSFSCGVYEIKFHPSDKSLLGVATTNAEIWFIRLAKHGDALGRRVDTKLIPVGNVAVAGLDKSGCIPIVTSFNWFPDILNSGKVGVDDTIQVSLAATLSSGEVRIVKAELPRIMDCFDARLATKRNHPISFATRIIRTHQEEAWTVASLKVHEQDGVISRLIVSGADDLRLLATRVEVNTTAQDAEFPLLPPVPVWEDRKTHNAGITSILELPSIDVPHSGSGESPTAKRIIPVVTGSYDEHVRIITIDTTSILYKATLAHELNLNGGVFDLKLMDSYRVPVSIDNDLHHRKNYLIVASCMHAGAKILRATYTPSPSHDISSSAFSGRSNGTWDVKVEAEFAAEGHSGLVYSCDSIMMPKSEDHAAGEHTVVSTSFYEQSVALWRWVDEKKPATAIRI